MNALILMKDANLTYVESLVKKSRIDGKYFNESEVTISDLPKNLYANSTNRIYERYMSESGVPMEWYNKNFFDYIHLNFESIH